MKIEIDDTDHARLVALAKERGETDVSRVVTDVLSVYFEIQERRMRERRQQASKGSRWAELARRYRENPSLPGNSERLNDLVREFREEFAV